MCVQRQLTVSRLVCFGQFCTTQLNFQSSSSNAAGFHTGVSFVSVSKYHLACCLTASVTVQIVCIVGSLCNGKHALVATVITMTAMLCAYQLVMS